MAVLPENLRTRLAARLRRAAARIEGRAGPQAPQHVDWTPASARAAVALVMERTPERELLRRIVEADGRRVPLRELARDLGLPPVPALERDFPVLARFCARPAPGAAPTPPLPILAEEEGEDAWYWMAPADVDRFAAAISAWSPPEDPD